MSTTPTDASELSDEERRIVLQYQYGADDLAHAYRLLHECTAMLELPEPGEGDLAIAARILGALPKQRLPQTVAGHPDIHPTWLLTESWLLQGKDPSVIHIAALRLIFNSVGIV